MLEEKPFQRWSKVSWFGKAAVSGTQTNFKKGDLSRSPGWKVIFIEWNISLSEITLMLFNEG